jgi:hypothetical protein
VVQDIFKENRWNNPAFQPGRTTLPGRVANTGEKGVPMTVAADPPLMASFRQILTSNEILSREALFKRKYTEAIGVCLVLLPASRAAYPRTVEMERGR